MRRWASIYGSRLMASSSSGKRRVHTWLIAGRTLFTTSFGLQLVEPHTLRENRGSFIGLGIALLVLGALAILMPVIASLVTAVAIGGVLVASGLFQGIHAIQHRRWANSAWSLASALIQLAAGVLIVAFPVTGTVTLTLILAAFFFAEGFLKIVRALQHREMPALGLAPVRRAARAGARGPDLVALAEHRGVGDRAARRRQRPHHRHVDAADRVQRATAAGGQHVTGAPGRRPRRPLTLVPHWPPSLVASSQVSTACAKPSSAFDSVMKSACRCTTARACPMAMLSPLSGT